jgi:hypothetical protein
LDLGICFRLAACCQSRRDSGAGLLRGHVIVRVLLLSAMCVCGVVGPRNGKRGRTEHLKPSAWFSSRDEARVFRALELFFFFFTSSDCAFLLLEGSFSFSKKTQPFYDKVVCLVAFLLMMHGDAWRRIQ